MSFKGFSKKSKRCLAFLLAVVLFFNAWVDFEFSVFAEDGLTVTFTPESPVVYTGEDLMPTVKVEQTVSGNETSELGKEDYDIEWKNSSDEVVTEIINAGRYTATVTTKDGSKSEEKTFEVGKKSIEDCSMYLNEDKITDGYDKLVYNGSEIKPSEDKDTIQVKDGDREIACNLTITGKTNAGEMVTIVATPKDTESNYEGTLTKEITIQKKELTDDMITINGIKEEGYIYTGEPIVPDVSVVVDGKPWKKGVDYEVTCTDNTNVTEAAKLTIAVTEDGTYSGNYIRNNDIEKTFIIKYLDVTEEVDITDAKAGADEDWYAGDVTITAPDGYTIGTDLNQQASWGNSLTITENGEVTYRLRNAKGLSKEYKITINIDKKNPVIVGDITVTPSKDEWANKKTATIKVSDEHLWKVKYQLGDGEEKVIDEFEAKPESVSYNTINIDITDEILKDESKTLTVTAIDKAGRSVSKTVDIIQIDKTAPVFGYDDFNNGTSVQWINKLTEIDLQVTDGERESGVNSVVVDKSNGITISGNDVEFTAVTEGKITYTFTATDKAGNYSTAVHTVGVDTTKPVVSISENALLEKEENRNNGASPVKDKDGIYWFGKSAITIPVVITGEKEDSAPYRVEWATDELFTDARQLGEDGALNGNKELELFVTELEAGKTRTYYFRAIDEAGNVNEISITVGYDGAPSINTVSVKGFHPAINPEEGDYWINGTESEDGKLEFTLNIEETVTAITNIEYKYKEKDGEYTDYKTPESFKYDESKRGYVFKTIEELGDNTNYAYTIRITNAVGNTDEFEVTSINVDRTLPENTAYIKFFSDVAGDNSVSVNDAGEADGTVEDGNWVSKFMEMVSGAWNKIWGRTEIAFEIYVRDAGEDDVHSGIASLTVTSDGNVLNITKVEEEKGTTATINEKNYTIYKGVLTCKEPDAEHLEAKDITIKNLTDIAGNVVTDDIVLKRADGESLIYLDSVAPKLKVSATNVPGTTGENIDFSQGATYYTNASDASITLTIEERFLAEKVPTVRLESKTSNETQWNKVDNYNGWKNEGEAGEYKWELEIPLAPSEGAEIEYRLLLQYADSSGNYLVDFADDGINTGVTAEGKYISSTFVVDNKAPELSYSVSGKAVCTIGESTVYENVTDKEDLTVTVVIDDDAEYFNDDNLIVSYVNTETNEKKEFGIVKPMINERLHTFVFTCEDKFTPEGEYYVTVAYADRAGNALTPKAVEDGVTFDDENGVYTSKTYIIDQVKPLFGVSYAKVARIVDTKKWEEILAGAENYIPQKGYTAYFKDGLEVTFVIEEKYTNYTNNALEHYLLEVEKDGEIVYSVDSVSGNDSNGDISVTWDKAGSMKVSIPKKDDNSTDGTYKLKFTSRDCAGNIMTVKDKTHVSVAGLFDEKSGTYTSPELILDTKAPETTAYIQFTTDVEGDNNTTDIFKLNDNKTSEILKMAYEWGEIWGQKKISFNVYVYDSFSGIKEIQKNDSIQMSYDGGFEILKLEEANKANIKADDGSTLECSVYKGVLEYDEEMEISDLKIDFVKDIAGNETKDITFNGTIYLDNVSPKFNAAYDDAYQLVDNDWNTLKSSTTPQEGYTAYYNEDFKVTFTVDEAFTKALDSGALEHHRLVVKKVDGTEKEVYSTDTLSDSVSNIAESGVNVVWTNTGSNYQAVITISAEGDYKVEFESTDCTGNVMEAKETTAVTVEGLLKDGVYTSPLLVLDKTAPVLSYSYENTKEEDTELTSKEVNGEYRYYFDNTNMKIQVSISDNNIRYKELQTVLKGVTATDSQGKKSAAKDSKIKEKTALENKINKTKNWQGGQRNLDSKWEVNLPLSSQANYKIPIGFTDLAGNAVATVTEYVTVDVTKPKIKYEVLESLDGQNGETEKGVDYSIKETFSKVIEKFLGFFFKNTNGMKIKVTVEDDIAGIETKESVFTEKSKATKENVKTNTLSKVVWEVPIEKDCKDRVQVSAVDYSGNEGAVKVGAFVVESENGKITVDDSGTAPAREEGKEKYYNTDVSMAITFEERKDGNSGLSYREYKFDENVLGMTDYKENASGKSITYKDTASDTITASSYNKNNIMVSASMIDNSGNEFTYEHDTIYNIDTTKPTIEVTYDNNSPFNEKYYNTPRIATVTITERNFDENDVIFTITSTDGPQPSISGWTHSGEDDDTNTHTCTVSFEEDSDYTFTLEFEDMAGNKADYSQLDEFTIDKTLPEMTVTYDNNEYLNEYYYNATRTATIDILEHNFNPEGIQINVTADGGNGGASISSWTKNGDHNIATVTFANDAEYTLDIEGVDLAENELADYEMDRFIVDKTVPELEIFDIEDLSANKGEVRPGIRYFDTNYDADGTVVVFKGYHNGEMEMDGDKSLQANGLELKLYDIPHVQSNDDIYTMEATVYDLAGNSSEASVMFSVNRFGSVYTFDEATESLVGAEGKYYTNEEQDIVITETNVDTLEFKEITCNLNGKLSTLVEGEDYSVYLDGSETTWKQYTYTIFEENFKDEGTYIITTYSEDKATNSSDNNSKGKSVEFVVDKTNPSVLISGVENGGQYRKDTHEMTLDIEDNIRLYEVIVDINGKETRYSAAQIDEMNGKITFKIESDNQWQEIKVIVVDAAGNQTVAKEMRVLVTANIFVQFISNKLVLYGTIGTVAAALLAVWWFRFKKKTKTEA